MPIDLRKTPRPLAALSALLVAGCAGSPTPAPIRDAACAPVHDSLKGETRAVTVRLPSTPDGVPDRGRLVVSRVDVAVAEVMQREGWLPLEGVLPFILQSRVFEVSTADLADGVRCAMPGVAVDPSTRSVALFEYRERFWDAVMGGGPRLMGEAADVGAAVHLRAHGFSKTPAPETGGSTHCIGPRFVHLAGADPTHHACALLPKDHDPAERYPAIYMLSGLAGDDTNRFGWSGFVELVDRIAAETGRGAIYIGVDTRSPRGSIYPTDAGSGAWLDWLTEALPAAAEARVGADPARRALMGQSTGGFNAVTIALLRPGAFRAVAASAPDALDMRAWLIDGERIDPRWLAWMRLEDGVGGAGQMVSYAAAWSADGAAMPADLDTGAIRPDVLDRWLRHSPIVMLDDPARQAALKGLGGRLHLIVGDDDEFGLTPPALRFAERLDALGIEHALVVDAHGHFGLDKRLPHIFRALLAP